MKLGSMRKFRIEITNNEGKATGGEFKAFYIFNFLENIILTKKDKKPTQTY